MTRKDYERIARALSEATAHVFSDGLGDDEKHGARRMRRTIMAELVRELVQDNPRFDADKFWNASLKGTAHLDVVAG